LPKESLPESPSLWAPYGDAIKLILTGTVNNTLTASQKAIYTNMLAAGMTNARGGKRKMRKLPGIQTSEHIIDVKSGSKETYYYIPDVFRYMISRFHEWDITAPPVNLDYLNTLPGFMYGSAPGQKQWEESPEGRAHWDLICRKIDLEKQLAELDCMSHQNDPVRYEAEIRIRAELKRELYQVISKMDIIEKQVISTKRMNGSTKVSETLNGSKFVPYPRAFQILNSRLNTTPEEIAAWIWFGPENGGLSAYQIPDEAGDARQFYFSEDKGTDYLSQMMACWF